MIFALLAFSRPRFWLYTAGTYAVGYVAGIESVAEIISFNFFFFFIFFLIPANLFLYGINDLYDHDTDVYNVKKYSQEKLLSTQMREPIRIAVFISVGLGVTLLFFISDVWMSICMIAFFFLAYAYSAPPFRFKSKPFIDSLSNIFYILPGCFGYMQATGAFPDMRIVYAASAWAVAMHLYSAIPDREPDMRAGIQTTAVFLGHTYSLITCALLWMVSGYIFDSYVTFPWSILGYMYAGIAMMLIFFPRQTVGRFYWYFPYINGMSGFVLYIYAVVS